MVNNFDDLLIHDQTKQALYSFIDHPSHALLLVGPNGTGKSAISNVVAAKLLGLASVELLQFYPYVSRLELGDGQSIAVSDVRSLVEKLQLRTPGSAKVRRIAIIDNAELMTTEAQNAILKSLEEPPDDTVFIINMPSTDSVLPTISSRGQPIRILPVSSQSAAEFYSGKYEDNEIHNAWNLSEGYVGLMSALLSGNSDHNLKKSIDEAKNLLSFNRYERLLYLDTICKDRDQLSRLVLALQRIMSVLHHVAISKENDSQAQRLLSSRLLLSDCHVKLTRHAQPRLVAIQIGLGLSV